MQFDRTKFRAAVHYVCAKCPPEQLGFVKLHKILYFADMLHFADTARALTGETYRKQQFGPVAEHLWGVLAQMERDGEIRVETRPFYGFAKKDFISLSEPDVSCLDLPELELLDNVIEFSCGRTAKELSELSHEYAWRAADTGEELPYFTAFQMFPVEISDDAIEWGAREAEEIVNQGLTAS